MVGRLVRVHQHLFPERADQEMILVVLADFPRVGEAVHVELVIGGLADRRGRGLGNGMGHTSSQHR